nr:TadE/TadG family type IV pilus assembly protein [Devosia sediminis]
MPLIRACSRALVQRPEPGRPSSLPARFARSEDGNFAILAGLLLPVILGSAALAVEYGHGLVIRGQNQRTADIAAFAGAISYTATKSEADMTSAAIRAAELNGIDADRVEVALVPSPHGEGETVQVDIRVQQTIVLGTLVGALPQLTIATRSFAAIGSGGPPACVVALDRSLSGIILSGGTSLSAPKCSVDSNSTIAVPCGTSITANIVRYDGAAPNVGCNGIRGPDGGPGQVAKLPTADPLAGNATIAGVTGRLAAVDAMLAPSAPSVPNGPNITFGYTATSAISALVAQAGCSVSQPSDWSGNWTVTCPANVAEHSFGNVTVSGGVRLAFNAGGNGAKRYNFGSLRVEGQSSFPDGNYAVARGIYVASNTVSFGRGTYRVGANTSGCAHSICSLSGGTLTFGGPSSFSLAAGIRTGGGARMTLGAGETNVFDLGAASTGDSITIEGGATTIFANAVPSGASNEPATFRTHGHVYAAGGGSCFIVSVAPQHDINGSFVASGAVVLGAGVYTVDGVFWLGSAGGGGAQCGGSTVSVKAEDVTIVLSGRMPGYAAGGCANTSFCVSAGYSNVVLRAPKTGANAGLAVVGPVNGNTAGASLVQGASNARISGAFYFPTGPIVMGGGSGLAGGGGDCLQVIGSRVELSGGASAASDCLTGAGGSGERRVVLVQ